MPKKANAIQTTNTTSDIIKKADFDTKIGKIEKKITDPYHSIKYITIQEFNRLTADNFATSLQQTI